MCHILVAFGINWVRFSCGFYSFLDISISWMHSNKVMKGKGQWGLITGIQSRDCWMMMLKDTGWMSTANKGLGHIISESPILSEICPRVWIIFWSAVYGYGESLHQAHNLIARLLLETFSIGTQTIDTSVSPTNLQFPQHLHWRYCVHPRTSHNMRKKYWWVKPSRSTCNKNKPPQITVNARQL